MAFLLSFSMDFFFLFLYVLHLIFYEWWQINFSCRFVPWMRPFEETHILCIQCILNTHVYICKNRKMHYVNQNDAVCESWYDFEQIVSTIIACTFNVPKVFFRRVEKKRQKLPLNIMNRAWDMSEFCFYHLFCCIAYHTFVCLSLLQVSLSRHAQSVMRNFSLSVDENSI